MPRGQTIDYKNLTQHILQFIGGNEIINLLGILPISCVSY